MTVKQLAIVVSVLLVVALLGGCGAQMPLEESVTTTTVAKTNDTTTTVESTTTNGVRTTFIAETSSTVSSSKPTQKNTSSTSGITAVSTTVSTTATTAAPTVHTLVPLAPSSYYGVSELKTLPNGTALVEAYEKIVEAVQNCQRTVAMDEKLTDSEILMVFYRYLADYPQHFWCNGRIRYTISGRSNKVTQVKLQYTMTGDELRQAQTDFNNAVVDLLKIASTGKDEYERELLLHDALAKHITYKNSKNAHNAYGALVKGEAVCEGYARAFQYLLYQSGIQCLMVEGSSINPVTGLSEGHAWNVVRVDGQYYHVDLTWDDPDDVNTPVMYPYFNLTTVQINDDHTIINENSYTLPNCEATANNFHVKNGTRLTECTVDSVAQILKKTAGDAHIYCVDGSQSFVNWFHNNHTAVLQAIGIYNNYSYNVLYTGNEVVVRLKIA